MSIDDLLLGEVSPARDGRESQETQETRGSENEGGMSEETAQKKQEDEQKLCKTLSVVGFVLSFLVCIAGLAVSAVAAWREGRMGEVKHLTVAGIAVGATLTFFLMQFLVLYLLNVTLLGIW